MKRTVLDKEARIYKSALRRGAGECFTMLSTESARRKFRPLVMWACTCDLAYDVQIEGSRALLLYDLIGRYHDAEAFLDIVEKKFFESIGTSGRHWLFVQECELLSYFSDDGNDRAKNAIERGYDMLYQRLSSIRPEKIEVCCSSAFATAIENYSALCDLLMRGPNASVSRSWLSRIVMDVGRLCLDDAYWNDLATEIDMSARYAAGMGERGLAAVLRRLWPSNEAKSFMAAVASENERCRMRKQRPALGYRAVYNRLRENETSTAEMRSMVRRWRKDGRTKDIEGLASMYTREEYPDIRASLLEVFSASGLQCECYLPLDDMIRDSVSANEKLALSALNALSHVRNQRVHDMAIEKMAAEGVSYEVFNVLAFNYREEDDAALVAAAGRLGDMRQDALTALVHLVGRGSGVSLSKRMLLFLYGEVQCSHCREAVVLEMRRRGLLTDEMLSNCLHDANDHIRRYASRLLKRRSGATVVFKSGLAVASSCRVPLSFSRKESKGTKKRSSQCGSKLRE